MKNYIPKSGDLIELGFHSWFHRGHQYFNFELGNDILIYYNHGSFGLSINGSGTLLKIRNEIHLKNLIEVLNHD